MMAAAPSRLTAVIPVSSHVGRESTHAIAIPTASAMTASRGSRHWIELAVEPRIGLASVLDSPGDVELLAKTQGAIIILGLVIGIGYALPLTAVDAIFDPNKPEPWAWFAITAVYHLLGLLIVAVLVSIWH